MDVMQRGSAIASLPACVAMRMSASPIRFGQPTQHIDPGEGRVKGKETRVERVMTESAGMRAAKVG